jgi:hypothetical protein
MVGPLTFDLPHLVIMRTTLVAGSLAFVAWLQGGSGGDSRVPTLLSTLNKRAKNSSVVSSSPVLTVLVPPDMLIFTKWCDGRRFLLRGPNNVSLFII